MQVLSLPLPFELCELIDQAITISHFSAHQEKVLHEHGDLAYGLPYNVEPYKTAPLVAYKYQGRERLVKNKLGSWVWLSTRLNDNILTGLDLFVPIRTIDDEVVQGTPSVKVYYR
jgi:hypothetical protein